MGLYLCIFDEAGDDICGVEVGLYQYFGDFRATVDQYTNKGLISLFVKPSRKIFSSPMSTLLNHSDCDGSWSVQDCKLLKAELEEIKQVFCEEPPSAKIIASKQDIFQFFGITPKNLFECFVDSDCEFLIDRLIELCNLAMEKNRPIMFQ